jgi:hypothetical protein
VKQVFNQQTNKQTTNKQQTNLLNHYRNETLEIETLVQQHSEQTNRLLAQNRQLAMSRHVDQSMTMLMTMMMTRMTRRHQH